MTKEQFAHSLPPYLRNDAPVHRLLGNEAHRPAGAALRRWRAHHGDYLAGLPLRQKPRRSGPLPLMQCPYQPFLQVAAAYVAHRGLCDAYCLGRSYHRPALGQQLQRPRSLQDPHGLAPTACQCL